MGIPSAKTKKGAKTDPADARLLRTLVLEGRFPPPRARARSEDVSKKEISMRKVAWAGAGIICAAVVLASLASADPTLGHFANVRTPSPPMRCEVGSDDSDGVGPNVVCQTAGFSQAPLDPIPYPGWQGDPSVLHQDQAIITASRQFSWRTANLGVAPPGQPDITLVEGQTYHFQGWTAVPTSDGTTFTNDATGHGMVIGSDYKVKPF